MPVKRRVDNFDPNKSDSADTDFDPTEVRASAKKPQRASKKLSGGNKKRPKVRRYKGSDVSDDDVDESLDDLSFSEEEDEDEEPVEMSGTGRAIRKVVAKKTLNYEEDSNSDSAESMNASIVGDIDGSESDVPKKRTTSKRSRKASTDDDSEADKRTIKRSKVVKLRIGPPQVTRPTRSVGSRKNSTIDTSSTVIPRRTTRAHSHDSEAPISLSNSGNHIIRDGQEPEPIIRRATRAGKGLKQPASTIKEEAHESSSYEQADNTTMATEIAGTDEQDDQDEVEPTSALNESTNNEATMIDGLGAAEAEVQPSVVPVEEEDDEDDEIPVRPTRTRGSRAGIQAEENDDVSGTPADEAPVPPRRLARGSKSRLQKQGVGASSDNEFEPANEASEDDISASDQSPAKKADDNGYNSSFGRGRRGNRVKSKSSSRRRDSPGSEEVLDEDELAEELQELRKDKRKKRTVEHAVIEYTRGEGRARKKVDYSIKPMDQIYAADEDDEDAQVVSTSNRRGKGGRSGYKEDNGRMMHSTFGPFGGGGGLQPAIGGPWGTGAIGGVESDSSDDETMIRPAGMSGNVGMTPTSAMMPSLLPGMGQANNPDNAAAMQGAALGKIKSQKALADADPLGVDQNVDFSKIGGLEGHIDQLKEMVQMPLLYPELFLKFHVTPPRGVLFHGPPGTGKTLLARALAAQVGSGGRKITFYMRKGADALSKWVGEAERQLRLLFEEARKTQPSIIFFDEIDGLAPVRSSKQEQIHASIVSTLLALMDGMDGRGQVIVIGATNRPDNIDPALRRPGRFDREFYFPLPDIEGRKSILNIHTKDWGIDDAFKTSLAHVTKGYGGADLRALCTEAALNAIQRTYPQIYSSNDKLKVDESKIKVTAKDFMLSVKKMIPSSERSTSSGAAPLPKSVEPLLREQLKRIEGVLDGLIPIKKKTTALQEAMYEQYEDDDHGFGRETLQQDFEKSRVFRPRLLIGGEPGMGQSYLGGAILNHFEGLHVQSFDLPTIYSDSARSPEAAIVQLFAEVKRHKPSVIYLPGIDNWYHTLSGAVITTFLGLLRAIPPTDPVLVLGITDSPPDKVHQDILRDLFGFSQKNRFMIDRPTRDNRIEFFSTIAEYLRKEPKDFPDPVNRKKRKLEILELAPIPPPKPPTKEEIKAQKQRDHQILNLLKMSIQPIMNEINKKYKKLRQEIIPLQTISYLLDEVDDNFVQPDIPQFRPFEWGHDKTGVKGLVETQSDKFYYNLQTSMIEERLANGFYARPKDFLEDIRRLAKDAKRYGLDKERILRTKELVTNVEVDIAMIEANPTFADCENVYQRQLQRAKEKEEKAKSAPSSDVFGLIQSDIPANGTPILGPVNSSNRPNSLVTPLNSHSNFSNGYAADNEQRHTSNRNSVPSRSGDDTHMSGNDEQGASQEMPPPHRSAFTGTPNTSHLGSVRQNTQLSQRSALMEISHDQSPHDLINNASTTTSGKRTSQTWSTQATNGVSNQYSSSPLEKPGDSQLPDTQRDTQQSSSEWAHSQAHAYALGRGPGVGLFGQVPSNDSNSQSPQVPYVPPFHAAGPRMPVLASRPIAFANILNDTPSEPTSSQSSSQKDYILSESFVGGLSKRLVEGSSGCSIEQLEQINRELMETLWRLRGEWNRNIVAGELTRVFNETIMDIEEMQRILAASQ